MLNKRILLLFLILIISFFMIVYEQIFVHEDLQFFAMVIYAISIFLLIFYIRIWYRRQKIFVATAFYQIFYFVGILLGSFLSAIGAEMYEIGKIGYPNGSFWLIVVFVVSSLEFSHFGYVSALNSKAILKDYFSSIAQKNIIYLLIVLIILLSTFIVFKYGSPLTSGVNRVRFWGDVAPSYLSFIRILIITTFYSVAYLYVRNILTRRSVVSDIVAALIYILLVLFLLGEKFSVFIMMMHAWLFVNAALRGDSYIESVWKWISVGLIILLINVSLVYMAMGLGGDFVINRMALQGQVIWSVMNESYDVLLMGGDWLGAMNVEPKDNLARRYLPPATYDMRGETGTSLSGYSPALLIFYFGLPFGIVVNCILSWLLGFIQGRAMVALRISGLIYGYVYYVIYFFAIMVVFVGNFNLVVTVIPLFMFLFLYKALFMFKRKIS